MLKSIYIDGFKSFCEDEINLNKLTLLTGPNSAGKSTVIQALLLLAHNVDLKYQIEHEQASPLNSYRVSLGDFSEIRNKYINAKELILGASTQNESLKIRITNSIEKIQVEYLELSDELKKIFSSKNKKLHYLSANRIGAQDLYAKNINNFEKFGMLGEFAIDYLYNHKNQLVINELVKNDTIPTLGSQTDYWLQYILNSNIKTSAISGTDMIQSSFTINMNNKSSAEVRPKNIGSGLSFVISILVACLASNIGDVIIIENPEIHLHPKAQSKLTDFLVAVAKSGIQLIIETHSDHIFNGIRRNLKQNKIYKEDVCMNFLELSKDNLCTKCTNIVLEQDGRIKTFPKGFFDQFDEDLDAILGIN